jgi:hypothetical protein
LAGPREGIQLQTTWIWQIFAARIVSEGFGSLCAGCRSLQSDCEAGVAIDVEQRLGVTMLLDLGIDIEACEPASLGDRGLDDWALLLGQAI